ncbi:MAG: serine/threonine-protein phosphatase [Lachnospiraceae bacterium]|nr:serine/threonine-protein phosphatase [Lachnospiraceae bacterium]
MVIGKTLIKDHTLPDRDLGEVFTRVNDLLCEANSEGLFITAFEGVLDLATGELNFVNAGHEMPFLCKKGGSYEPYKIRPGFVLAGMEGMRYRGGSMTLDVGDRLFQYTDGVTEAMNAAGELYGMRRLGEVLNRCRDLTPTKLLPEIKADIDRFAGDAPQFDDITMLCLEYKAKA